MIFNKTTDTLTSDNYPYGFSLRTTKTDWLDFDPKRGFRHCSQTVDPRNGRLNAPKKATYNDIMVIGRSEENNHVVVSSMSFYDKNDVDNIVKFFADDEHFNLFTAEQIEYIYLRFISYIKISIMSQIQYCGGKKEDLITLYDNQLKLLVEGAKSKGTLNVFKSLSFDWDKIDSCKEEGYQPFKVTSYGI